jgi:hypothetical protein
VNVQQTNGHSVTEVLPEEDDEPLVYFMWSAGLVKIGWTRDIMRRWDELQIRSAVHVELLVTMDGGPELELDLHRIFKESRGRGEWFQVSDTMRGFFKYLDDHREEPSFPGTITERLAALEGRSPVIGEYAYNAIIDK